MTPAVLTVDGWTALLAWLSAGLDLNTSARDHGALRRRRGLRSAEDLPRLALICGATPSSLRTTAAAAQDAAEMRCHRAGTVPVCASPVTVGRVSFGVSNTCGAISRRSRASPSFRRMKALVV